MFIRKSVGIAIASVSIAAAAVTGFAVNAQADTTTPSPSASATVQAQRGPNTNAPRTGVCDGTGVAARAADGTQSGIGNGYRYGFTWMVNYLAEKLGVDADKVSTALQAYHADNPTTEPVRTLTEAQIQTRHEEMAKYLGDKLGVDSSKVLAALNAMQDTRQAENQAAPGGHGPHR